MTKPTTDRSTPRRGLDLTVGRHLRLNLYVSPAFALTLISLAGTASVAWTSLRGA
ncbi:hypothetical protein [Embleya hyalina]|uniref:Uncharacterized protein n=1 Tax=Embleya hyalina TaxID=516124 RepID=A0A401YGK5_9ACTN|nr:hypothetical protein [Embleya hyalina]GCD93745.1 hypothetical protein EHYA_01393 [Embleya hyalina]